MDPETVKEKANALMQSCTCGSGKPSWQCHGAEDAKEIENEPCICGSGNAIKDCCMKNPETHEGM
jgi:uncharacterized protein YchJ